MKVPFSWLKEYLPTKLSPKEVAEMLTVVGLEVEAIDYKEDGEPILEIALTPNMAFCASIRGVARELEALSQEKLIPPTFSITEKKDQSIHTETSVIVENREACPRYTCRVIKGVTVGPSPDWLKERLEKCGLRSVNTVVDSTNFVLLELGHPLHAFDLDTLGDGRIVVRNAKPKETIITLDDKERHLTEEMLVICDSKKPIAVAGVMGSLHTEVSDKTKNILLESAYFEPKQVRKTSKQLGVQTEASYRFERGVDPNGVLEALDRAASWVCELAGGTVLQGIIDIKEGSFPSRVISCRLPRVNQVLGTQLAMSEVEAIFRSLGFGVHSLKQDVCEVTIPTYRHDIHQEIDLIEEVARLYGFNNIHKKKKETFRTGTLPHASVYYFERAIRSCLVGEGLQEFLTCDLINPQDAELALPAAGSLISLLNPRSTDQSVLRSSLLPSLLQVVKHNADHEIHSVAGFELGRVHVKSKDRYLEPSVVSIVLTGNQAKDHWQTKSSEVDFFHLKGIIENLIEGLKIEKATFRLSNHKGFHPGRQASIFINEMEIGLMGELHPQILKKMDLVRPLFFAELNLEDLKEAIQEEIKMVPLPLYPASARDWTFTLLESYPVEMIFTLIKQQESKLLETVSLLDVYQSKKLGCDWRNVTFRFIYRDREKTISLKEIENEHNRIRQNIWNQLKEANKVKEQP